MRASFLLDECIESRALADQLRRAGWDVVTAGDAGLRAEVDEAVAQWAIAHGRAVVTYNCQDFRELATRLAPRLTVVGIRRGASVRERLSHAQIVRCLENLEGLGQDFSGTFVELHEYKW